jgi:chemotaxis protein methyltransferase WspC
LKIETLLKKKIGLNPDSIGQKKIDSDVRRCMAAIGMTDAKEYLALLQTSTAELEKLIETITVPETWFFRNRGAFDYLESHARKERTTKNMNTPLRILSVPCATGEEAYSIAMTLLNAGVLSEQFHIDATDISKKVLAGAEHAVYGKNSFRGKYLAFRLQYFTETDKGYRLLPEVKQTVEFSCDNILAPFFLSNQAPYDVIFCRNLLIYFDPEAQQRAIRVLDRLLKKKGLLFVGHSETGLFADRHLSPVRHTGVFAFLKGASRIEGSVGKPNGAKKTPGMITAPKKAVLPRPPRPLEVPATVSNPSLNRVRVASKATESDPNVKKARSLADTGRLFEAAELCETRLKDDNKDTEAYCLLGLIRLALDDDAAAEQYFNKAVYLDPNHYEALVHLALMREHRGDKESAFELQQRAERARKYGNDKEIGQ